MEYQVARRSDGAIAVVTRVVDGWAYGDLILPSGQRMENLPMSIAALVSRGEWERLPGMESVGELMPAIQDDRSDATTRRPW